MVDDIQVEEKKQTLSICLRTLFVATAGPQTVPVPTSVAPGQRLSVDDLTLDDLTVEDLRAQHHELSEAFHELQSELEETNRGVVALHAELEANADELRQAEDRLRLLLDSVQDYAICMLTPEGEIASWNAGAERLFGYGADEIIGRRLRVSSIQPCERDLDIPAEHLREADDRGRHAGECCACGTAARCSTRTSSSRRCAAAASATLRGFSLVVRDITERKRLEDGSAPPRRRARRGQPRQGRFPRDAVARAPHAAQRDARLDAAAARWASWTAPRMTRALETIERNAHIQEQLIADILDVSRIVTGKLRLELRPIELAPVVDAALDAVRPAAAAKGIQLVEHTAFEGTVLGDPDRLQQVVWNLLANAIKFTPAGGRVELADHPVGPSAVLTVTDTGEGIAPSCCRSCSIGSRRAMPR